jgi:hypothetical protein
MIESKYWKSDLLAYAKKFRAVDRPPRWSERLQVHFEKDVILAFFMIRKLSENHKFSPQMEKHRAQVYRSPCVGVVNNWNFAQVDELYDYEREERLDTKIAFVCNQFIHSGAMYAYRKSDRNWGGIYVCSDFEREKFIYRVPLGTIIEILETAGNDYPESVTYQFDNDELSTN